MYKNGTYGSISTASSTSNQLGGQGSSRRREEDRQRRKAQAASKMGDDFDISAILAATSITSITGQPSKVPPPKQDKDVDRGKGKGKEKVQDGHSSSDRKGKSKSKEQIFHTVALSDTLEGIAVRYGVQVANIKRVNRLFSNQDLFARKEVVIPNEEVEEETTKPRRSYEKDIKSPRGGRRSFEKDTPKFAYPATPEDEVPEQRRSLLGFGYNLSSQNGEDAFQGLGSGEGSVRIRQMGEKVRRRLEEEEDKLYGL